MGKSNPMDKSFDISKRLVWEAYKSVKANQGAAGVDGRSYSAGLSVGGSHAPVVKSWRRASSLSSPHLVAVSR